MSVPLSRWFRPGIFVAAVVVLLGVVAWSHPLSRPWRSAAEAAVYLLLTLACASAPAVRRVVAGLGWPRLAVLGLVLAVATTVQLVKSYGPAYPFVRWTMYGSADPPPHYPDFQASLASGRTVPFPFDELTPSRSPRAFQARFTREVRRIHAAPAGHADEAAADLERLLAPLVRSYNTRHPGDPVTAVRVGGCAVPIHDYRGPASIPCEYVASFDFTQEARR